jgi:hypothetical protein
MLRRILLLLAATSLIFVAYTQQRDWPTIQREQSQAAERKGKLDEAFVGITATGTAEAGLFPIKASGVSTAPVVQAARAFLATLSPEQRAKTQFPVDDIEWRKWMNQDFYIRQGMGFADMTPAQREAAFAIFKAG